MLGIIKLTVLGYSMLILSYWVALMIGVVIGICLADRAKQ